MAPAPTTADYYAVLEIDQDATPELITRAYRRLAFKLHPDRNPETGSTQAFQLLSQAYETLIDEDKRRDYDRVLTSIHDPATVGHEDCATTFERAPTPRRRRERSPSPVPIDTATQLRKWKQMQEQQRASDAAQAQAQAHPTMEYYFNRQAEERASYAAQQNVTATREYYLKRQAEERAIYAAQQDASRQFYLRRQAEERATYAAQQQYAHEARGASQQHHGKVGSREVRQSEASSGQAAAVAEADMRTRQKQAKAAREILAKKRAAARAAAEAARQNEARAAAEEEAEEEDLAEMLGASRI